MEGLYKPTLQNHCHICPHIRSKFIDLKEIKNTFANCYFSFSSLVQLSRARVSSQLKTGSNWGRKQNRYKLTPATWNRIQHSVSRDTFETSAHLYACLLCETFAVSVSLPALSRPCLMILVLRNLTVTVYRVSNEGLFSSPYARHHREGPNLVDSVIVFFCSLLQKRLSVPLHDTKTNYCLNPTITGQLKCL